MLLGNFQKKAKPARGSDRAPTARPSTWTPSTREPSSAWPSPTRTMGRLDEALVGFERAQRLDPRATARCSGSSPTSDMRRGRFEEAEAVLEDALARKVDEHRFLLKLGES